MSRTIQTATDIGGEAKAITKPGTYHVTVTHSADGQSTKGNSFDGCCALLSVLAGTEEDQAEKEFHLHLMDVDLSKGESEGNKWREKKQTAYAIAINQLEPSKMGESVSVDFDSAEGQQFIITLGFGTEKKVDEDGNEVLKDGKNVYIESKKNLELKFASIYHVDDPRAAKFPKNKEALAILPKELRKPKEFFAPLQKKNGSSKGSSKSRLSESDLNDL